MTKEEMLKPRLIQTIDRLKHLIELNAPGCVIAVDAFQVFATALAVYGEKVGNPLTQLIRDSNLHRRGVCTNGDCTNFIPRPNPDICKACARKIGATFLDELDWEAVAAAHPKNTPNFVPWQLADDKEAYGDQAAWWIVVSPDFEEEHSEPFATLEECKAEIENLETARAEAHADPYPDRQFPEDPMN